MKRLDAKEYYAIGQAVVMINTPWNFKKEERQELCYELIDIIRKYAPRERDLTRYLREETKVE